MRTFSELNNYARRFDEEQNLEFTIDNLADVDLSVIDRCQQVLPLTLRGGSAPSLRKPALDAQPRLVTPANNMGSVKYRRNWGGYDGGVEAGFTGIWRADKFAKLAAELDNAKQAADSGDINNIYVDLGGFIWRVNAVGAKFGSLKYKWVCEHCGVKLFFHSNAVGSIQPVRVRFGAECLYRNDLFQAVNTLKYILNSIGFTCESETVSRVDMQVLLPVPIFDFLKIMKTERIVTLCRGKFNIYGNISTGQLESWTLTSSTMELCIYDKIAEVCQKDSVGYEMFRQYVLDGEKMPEHITRVEYRFKRAILKRYGIDTFHDLFNSQLALIQIASSEWFRVLADDKIRGHENTQDVADLWQDVQNRFIYYFGSGYNAEKRGKSVLKSFKPVKNPPKIDLLIRQAVGILASVCAYKMANCESKKEVFLYSQNVVKGSATVLQHSAMLRHVDYNVQRGYNSDGVPIYACTDKIKSNF